MGGSIYNNGSASGRLLGASYTGSYTLGTWLRLGAGQYNTSPTYKYLTNLIDSQGLEHYTESFAGQVRYYTSGISEQNIFSGFPVFWFYFRLVKDYGPTDSAFTVQAMELGTDVFSDVVNFNLPHGNLTDWSVFDTTFSSGLSSDAYVRSWRLYQGVRPEAQALLDSKSRVPYDPDDLIANYADGEDPDPDAWGVSLTGNNLVTSGTALYSPDDPISGLTQNPAMFFGMCP